jgi:membrane associated rhomboid family serine protease
MKRHPVEGGITWSCPRCDGRTATISLLRKALDADTVRSIWAGASAPDAPEGVRCPSCLKVMREVSLRTPAGYQAIDVCRPCTFLWFDPGEYHALPAALPDVREATLRDPRSIEAVARMKLEEEKERKTSSRTRRPDAGWKWLPGLMGMPVEFDSHEPAAPPIATWLLLAIVSAVSIFAFSDLDAAVDAFGFRPAEAWRMGGLTVLTAFFLHAGWMHLIGNMYFLWIFGDNSEDSLGTGRYLLLILLATITGGVLHAAMTDAPMLPAVGASGGISGIIAYYALCFPRMRIGLLFFFFIWLRIPALLAGALWVGMQLFGAFVVEDNIAYMAHLGGALAGVAFWGLGKMGKMAPKDTRRDGPKQRYDGRSSKHANANLHTNRYVPRNTRGDDTH